ncbi:DUF748 domain-containing protein [Aestuariirhabdus sp. Z084]|uniref:DUF748 domain-containing protein n=1 Tax=Aestuariirhabdus haliotis TaxID=2918751 RepID=UPI00201B4413|nr:DUF748 domain-containing protein [Aestuariirhabdus haliotis]MCL6416757.1 DUF748 domain-containing protein [Aestuariirhabdus haliotis]MCL6420778.1 DUF748 domain-containing protein [Aestuariirhabdus haliotis]
MSSNAAGSRYWNQLSSWQRRAIYGLIALVLYSIVGFLVLPEPMRSLLETRVSEMTGQEASLGRLEINPFDFSLSLRRFELSGVEQERQLAFDHLHLNLSVRHLFIGQLVLERFQLDRPLVTLVINQQQEVNWDQLIQKIAVDPNGGSDPEASEDASPLPLRVEHLNISQGQILFDDRSREEPYKADLFPLNLELFNFSTRAQAEEAPYSFKARLDQDTSLSWQGQLSLVPLRSEGALKLEGVRVRRLWEYWQEQFAFEVFQGEVSLSASYTFDGSGDRPVFSIEKGLFQLSDFNLGYKRAADNLISIPELAFKGISIDSGQQTVVIDQLSSRDAQISSQLKRTGEIDLLGLFARVRTAENAMVEQGAGTSASAAAEDMAVEKGELPWEVALTSFELSNYQIDFSDQSLDPSPSWTLQPLALQGGPVTFPQNQPLAFNVGAEVDDGAQLSLSGQLWFSPRVEMDVSVKDFDLSRLQSYLDPLFQVQLEQGKASLDGHLLWQGGEQPQLKLGGHLGVDELVTRDTIDYQEFVKWKALLVEEIAFDQQQRQLSIARIATNTPYARVIIYPDLSVNVSQILSSPTAADEPADETTSSGENGTEDEKPFDVSIGRIEIVEGEANFADLSLTPQFATGIFQLNGRVDGLSSDIDARAVVDISGKVDRYAPVVIKGAINPLSAEAFTDLGVSFKNVELTTLTPYSGKFAGYRIDKGKLSLDLQYQLENRQLQGDNKMVLDQLTLGSRTDSPDATSLPVTLAIALMKDSSGRIDIDLPVSGDLDNPEFSYGSLVAKAFINLITNIISSPFRALGSLLGEDAESYGNIGFPAGSQELSPEVRERLQTLTTALAERPTIKLELTGGSNQAFDWPVYAQLQWQQQLQTLAWQRLKAEGKSVPGTPNDLIVPTELKESLVVERFREYLGEEASQAATLPSLVEMEQVLIRDIKPQPSVLRQLAQQRAAEVRRYLVEALQYPAENLYLLEVNSDAPVEQGRVQIVLSLTD